MASRSGTMYQVIVTSLILGVTECLSGPTAPTSIQNTIMYDYPPSAPTSHVLFSSPPRNLDVAESGHFFSDGAIASHPLHGLGFSGPGLTGFMNFRGGSGPSGSGSGSGSGADILQTAAQTYFIEPVTPTTTTQRPTFKKRKTRRPITVLAEKQKKQSLQNDNNNNNNEISQGNPVTFNPFRQIVNTSFGRSRPSDSKLGRSRRPGAVGGKQEKPETGSDTSTKIHDSLNEVPSTAPEGEPRVLGQRRKQQDIRPLRPTSSFSPLSSSQNYDNDGGFQREVPKPRRFPPRPRLARPNDQENQNNPSGPDGVTDPPPPSRPRNLSRRPRPTTTFPSTEEQTDFTPGVTTTQTQTQPQTTQPQPPSTVPQTQPQPQFSQTFQPKQQQQQQQQQQQEGPRRARPGRPIGSVRFGGNRLSLTTTPLPEPDLNLDQNLPTRPRRPSRLPTSTTQQASNPSTERPVFSRLPQSPTLQDVPRLEARPLSPSGEKQGFILRPRPTSSPNTSARESGQQKENEVDESTRTRPLNRRRKRPSTTTAETPTRSSGSNVPSRPAVNYNQQFTGGIVQPNVRQQSIPANDDNNNQNDVQAPVPRRVPQVVRSRPSPFTSSENPQPYQIQDESPEIQPIRGQFETLRNPLPEEQPVPDVTPSPVVNSASLLRRPTGPSAPATIPQLPQTQTPIQQITQTYLPNVNVNTNPALSGPNNFNLNTGLYNFPSQENLGYYPGFDNVLGVSSNVKTVQESPRRRSQARMSQFSARTTVAADEPEISDNDFVPVPEKKSEAKISRSRTKIKSTANPISPENSSQENSNNNNNKVETSSTTTSTTTTAQPKKLSPLERLQQNRQQAAKRLLTPRKPTEKTTPVPPSTSQNQKAGKILRKSIIPPRMLRPRGKLLTKEDEKVEEIQSELSPSQENNDLKGEKSIEISNESTSSSSEPETESNIVPISPDTKTEEQVPTSSRKPTILENAMRRRIPLPGKGSPLNKQQQSQESVKINKQQHQQQPQSQESLKMTPPTPPNYDPDAPPPNCEAGQRYSKFLKRCVTMYKPKASPAQG